MLDTKIVSLLTLIDCGSYTKAARQLHLTQPAISHQIKQLEEEFQIKIFHRSKKSLILTPEGENFSQVCPPHDGCLQQYTSGFRGCQKPSAPL